jgi:hypothetical protein
VFRCVHNVLCGRFGGVFFPAAGCACAHPLPRSSSSRRLPPARTIWQAAPPRDAFISPLLRPMSSPEAVGAAQYDVLRCRSWPSHREDGVIANGITRLRCGGGNRRRIFRTAYAMADSERRTGGIVVVSGGPGDRCSGKQPAVGKL